MGRAEDVDIEEFVARARPDPKSYPQVFILGSADKRVTLYSQQVRACNLVYALHVLGIIRLGSPIAVVGAGAAGLSACGAALRLGCRVHLLERSSSVMATQMSCSTRWIDPYVYDWPFQEADGPPGNGVPDFSWKAGSAEAVAKSLGRAFEQLQKEHGSKLSFAGTVKRWQVDSKGHLEWDSAMPSQHRTGARSFTVVILALGFGEERRLPGIESKSYWENDDLQREGVTGARILVSGTGDGGLIDALRVRLKDFRQDLLPNLVSSRLREAMVAVAKDFAKPEANAPGWLFERYDDLEAERLFDSLDSTLRLRDDTALFLNGSEETERRSIDPRKSSFLHALILHRLTKIDPRYTYLPGRLTGAVREGGMVIPSGLHGAPSSGFHTLVVRHGPLSHYEAPPSRDYPSIAALASGWRKLNDAPATDLFPRPLWPDSQWWNRQASAQPNRDAGETRPGSPAVISGLPSVPRVVSEAVWATLATVCSVLKSCHGAGDLRLTFHRACPTSDGRSECLQQLSRYAGTRRGGAVGRTFPLVSGLAGRAVEFGRPLLLTCTSDSGLLSEDEDREAMSREFCYGRDVLDRIDPRTKLFCGVPLFSVEGGVIGVVYFDSISGWDVESALPVVYAACDGLLRVLREYAPRNDSGASSYSGHIPTGWTRGVEVPLSQRLKLKCLSLSAEQKVLLHSRRLESLLGLQ